MNVLNVNQFHDSTHYMAVHAVCQHNPCKDQTSWDRNAVHWCRSITAMKYCFMVKCVIYTTLFIQQTQFCILQYHCESTDR